MSRISAEDLAKWEEISTKKYADQCKWILNGFWGKLEGEAENIWKWCQTFSELDPEAKADGHELDEFWSHKFLETLGETMTVIEMREKFRKIDADFNKKMSALEYIIYRFNLNIHAVINAPQGDGDPEKINKAQAMVDDAQKAVEQMTAALDASTKAAAAAKAAELENKKALEELQVQEKAYEDKKSELAKIKGDMSIGIVKRNRAANELDQLLSEDPLPLRKAKITQAATVKKSEKATVAANEAKAKAEMAVKEAEAKLQEAMEYLEEAKASGGVAQGDIWWMQREITEKQKYLPAKRR